MKGIFFLVKYSAYLYAGIGPDGQNSIEKYLDRFSQFFCLILLGIKNVYYC